MTLPEVWMDEDGECYFAAGHVDPASFVLAVLVDMAAGIGDAEALDALGRTPELASSFITSVRHTWWKPTAGHEWGDDDRMQRAEAGDNNSRPFTEVDP